MRRHLRRAAHPDVPSAVLFVQMAVDALDGRAFVVAPGFRRGELDLLAPARVVVDERHVPQPRRHLADLLGVVGGVGQIIEVDDPSGGHLRQRDGGLAVVQAGGSEYEADRDIAVDHVQMGLVAAPAFCLALAVLLAAPVAGRGQVGQVFLQAAVELQLQPCRIRRRRRGLALPAPAAFAALGGGGRLRLGRGLLAGADRGGVAADVPGELVAIAGLDHRLVDFLRAPVFGEFGEGAREGRRRGHFAERLPAAQPAQGRTVADGVDQAARGVEVPDGLAYERLAHRQPVARRAAVAAPAVGAHVILRGAQLADRDELAVLLVEFPDLVLQHREEP